MELTRVSVPITVEEREAIRKLAKIELRDPREQIRYIIQRELINRGIMVENNAITLPHAVLAGQNTQ